MFRSASFSNMSLFAGRSAKKSRHILWVTGKPAFFPRILLLFCILFLSLTLTPNSVFARSQIAEYLCEYGISYFKNGDLEQAEHEFKKALIAEPGYPAAIYYLQLIREMSGRPAPDDEFIATDYPPAASLGRQAVMENTLNRVNIKETLGKTEGLSESQIFIPELERGIPTGESVKRRLPSKYFIADPNFTLQQPIEIEEGKYVVISGNNIQRFLVVQPELLYVERVNNNEISVMAKGRGFASIVVWDDSGRTSIECTGILPIPETPTLEEVARKEEESMGNFKLRYNLDWYSYYTGNRIQTIHRSGNYSWIHNLRMNGATPYGLLDSSVTMRVLPGTTDMTYVSAGLTNGNIGDFKGFNIRAGDYNPYFNNLAIPAPDLRGVYFYSPAFDNKLDYSVFWGRENGGRYGTLALTDYKALHSFMSGFNLNYSPSSWQNYKFSVAHGWGRNRQENLKDYAYDLMGSWNFGNYGYNYEIASDTKNLAQLFTTSYKGKELDARLQFRDIDKEFVSITGPGWRQGEFGALLNLSYLPTDKLTLTQRVDIYRDRLYPAEDNQNRFNEDLDTTINYKVDPLTNVEATYTLQNDLGKISQTRYQSGGLGASRLFSVFGKEVSTYLKYSHQDNKSYTSPTLDYENEKIFAGLRFSVIGALYYYYNRELNWLTEKSTSNHVRPNVTETGLDWYDRIGKTPFWGSLRFTYRDEERANSPLSFLAGEDYIEGYSELSYRPSSGQEIYASARVRNIWKENSATAISRVEASFNVGMKLLWDTGIRWDAVSSVSGYVFKDYNSNGLLDRDEPPVFGIKVWLGKNKYQITDELGYFKFVNVRGKVAYVTLDTGSLPAGYVLTVPVTQGVPIANASSNKVYFGITSRSEIRGVVFEDTNGDGVYSVGEKGVAGVAITMDGTKTVISGIDGRYTYPQAQAGEHELVADLNSIPVYYLPLVSLKKKFPLQEGESSVWNIPLRRIEK
ncbi:MAG: SdrD B-like domain-containing protein [Candidatus Omnitrophica bacterium]|nr:SdrD B-like domain-containing protein [Candidatus Omnitrophota bacterium]MDD5660320.1 SdrD B-like domain-containing protein [Candidatus Omnitrophota bacterium]